MAKQNEDGAPARRGRVGADQLLFFGVLALAVAGVLTAYHFQARAWVPLAIGVGAVLLYSGIAWLIPRFQVREDLVGDGAYYLGFLLTLVSLSRTLWVFSRVEGVGVEAVINGFGLALATTIVGLAVRVGFQQLREDPSEFENEARATLRDAVSDLEMHVRGSVEDLSYLRIRLAQELDQAVGQALQHMLETQRQAIEQTTQTFSEQMTKTLSSVAATADAVKEHVSESKTHTSKLMTAVSRLAARIDESEIPTASVKRQFDDVAAQMQTWLDAEADRIEKQRLASQVLLQVHEHMRATVGATKDVVVAVKDASAELGSNVAGVSATTQQLTGALNKLSSDIVAGAEAQRTVLRNLLGQLAEAAREVDANRRTLADAVKEGTTASVQLHRQVVDAAGLIVKELRRE